MSPAPARTSRTAIVAAGRHLLDSGGLDAVTMLAVADRVGVRAPSLYKRFANRGALLAAIAESALEDLRVALESVGETGDPAVRLRAMATAFRRFAHENPRAYELLFMNLPPDARPSPELNARAAAPLLEVAARLVDADRALEAARLVTAFSHGFVSMELTDSFRLAGDVDGAFRYGLDVLVEGLTRGDAGGTRRARKV